jgi:outer membrane murein-binding lipoprotein Lpp
MKKLLVVLSVAVLLLVFAGCTDTQMKTDVQGLKDQMAKMDSTITVLKADVEALKPAVAPKEEMNGGEKVNKTNEPVKNAPPKIK